MAILVGLGSDIFGQDYITAQIPKLQRYNASKAVDPQYGILMYEPLNGRLGGDSVRNCDGYGCSGWVEDFYDDNAKIHRGYYVEGALTIYKNFYPNGQVEREFRIIDDYKSVSKVYYDDGILKSEVRYQGRESFKWTDYYPNGQKEYFETYNKGFEYYLEQSSYYRDGKPESQLILENKKKLIFDKKDYFKNGSVKEAGKIRYNTDLFDYQKIGKWELYSDAGKLVSEQFYENGKMEKEKNY